MPETTTDTMSTEAGAQTDSVAVNGRGALKFIEDGMNTVGHATWEFFHHLPGHGTLFGGAVGLGAATLFGAAELAVGAFTAYVSYRVFAYGESLTEAIEKAIKFESGKLEQEEIDKPIPE